MSRRSAEELRAGGGVGPDGALAAAVAYAFAAALAAGVATVFAAAAR